MPVLDRRSGGTGEDCNSLSGSFKFQRAGETRGLSFDRAPKVGPRARGPQKIWVPPTISFLIFFLLCDERVSQLLQIIDA